MGLFNHRSVRSLQEFQLQVVWNKLYRREAINGIDFIKSTTEDTVFNCAVFLKAGSAALVEREMYYWVMRGSSITHQKLSKWHIDRASSYYHCLEYISHDNTLYRACCLGKMYKTMISVRHHARRSELSGYARRLVAQLKKKTLREFVLNRRIPPALKSALLLFLYVPSAYAVFIWLCEKRAARA